MIYTVPELGYCNECERPAVVVGMLLPGWRHVFRICSLCLGAIAKRCDNANLEHETGTAPEGK